MDGSVKSDGRLEVSVSFGRFENDALSWEKWSSFSPNKYLEEVGNLSTPGSVAQKKAYFEAHYRKIAARKAEELEQEKMMNPLIPSQDMSSNEEYVENSSENIDAKFDLSNGKRLVEEVAQEACMRFLTHDAIADEAKDDNAGSSEGDELGFCTSGLTDVIHSEEEKVDSAVAVNGGSSAIGEAKDELNGNVADSELNVRKDALIVGLETPQKDSQDIVEKPPERKNGIARSSVLKKENSKMIARNIAEKVTPTKKERNLPGTMKKVVSPAVKPLQASAPKYLKPISMSSSSSASQTLKKKVNESPLPKSKISPVGESKGAAPTSLHMSLSLGSANSLGDLSTTRKSLIMEKMGDKDIVKRAFKAFQSRTNGSTTDDRPSTVKHVSSTALEPKISTSRTPSKGKEGLRKDADTRTTQRSQSGTRSNPMSSGSYKSSPVDRKNTMTSSPATGLRSDEKVEKRKEFLKKLGAKSIAREAEHARLGAKSKVGSENGIHHWPTLNQ